jgi:hypothetical protein
MQFVDILTVDLDNGEKDISKLNCDIDWQGNENNEPRTDWLIKHIVWAMKQGYAVQIVPRKI